MRSVGMAQRAPRVSFSLEDEYQAVSTSTPLGKRSYKCTCQRTDALEEDEAGFEYFPAVEVDLECEGATEEEEGEEEEEEEGERRRRLGSGAGASSSSLSRYYCKSRSFSCLSDVLSGPHGDSAKSLEKSARPQKKRRHTSSGRGKHNSHDKAAVDDGSTTLSFKECRMTRSRFARGYLGDVASASSRRMQTGYAKDLSSPILLSRAKGVGEHDETPLSPEQAASSFDELCKSFETEMFLRSPSSSGRSESSCIDVT